MRKKERKKERKKDEGRIAVKEGKERNDEKKKLRVKDI